MQLIDVDRFNRRWPGRERVKISRREAGKRIAFENEIDPQVLFCRIPKRNLPADCEQNWPMENDQERRAYSEANHYATPSPVASHPCLILFSHERSLLPPRRRAKGKWRRRHAALLRHCVQRPLA